MNNDELTGKALTKYRSWTRGLHQINDALMREENCEVLPSPERARDDWDTRRGEFEAGGFEQMLGDKIMEVLSNDAIRDRASFERALEAEGIRLAETARDGVTYKMRRANGKWGRRKASSLCDEFTAKNVREVFEYRNKQIQEDNMKLIDKMKSEFTPQEDVQEVDLQETPPPPQVEEMEAEDAQEKYVKLTEFTEEQKQELWRMYDHNESRMHDIERENNKEYGSMNYLTRTVFEVDLERLADEWNVHEIDKDAALAAVKEVKEKNAQNAKNTPHTNREKSARTASEAKPQRSEQKPVQQRQQKSVLQQTQQSQKQLSPEEQTYQAARDGALNVIRRGEGNLMVILASWVMLARAERQLIKSMEKASDAEMTALEKADEDEYANLLRVGRDGSMSNLMQRAECDLMAEYRKGRKQLKKRLQKQVQQQDDADGAPTLTPEQQREYDAYQANVAKRQSRELEL